MNENNITIGSDFPRSLEKLGLRKLSHFLIKLEANAGPLVFICIRTRAEPKTILLPPSAINLVIAIIVTQDYLLFAEAPHLHNFISSVFQLTFT